MACKCVRSVSKSLTTGLLHTSSSWALAQCWPPINEAVYTLHISKVQYVLAYSGAYRPHPPDFLRSSTARAVPEGSCGRESCSGAVPAADDSACQ
jgi:hypothetical protein